MQQSKLGPAMEFVVFVAISLPTLVSIHDGTMSEWAAITWGVACVCFGIAFGAGLRRGAFARQGNRSGAVLLLTMTLCGLVMLYATFFGATRYLAAISLWIVARRFPYIASPRAAWIGASGVAAAAIAIFVACEGWRAAIIGGAATTAMLIHGISRSLQDSREQASRTELALSNAELLASRELLAENSRVAERLRISRDLHDTLGHHLAALSIQLDVAARRSEGAVAERIREAHAITRLLLGDVRNAVQRVRHGGVNVATLVRPLCKDIGDLRIHLDVTDAVTTNDTIQAEVIVRCVQEVVTNTLRHAQARNLWVRISQDTFGVDIRANDDGRGVDRVKFGYGFIGMQERFAQHGGRIEVSSGTAGGFSLHAILPEPEVAS
jgi:signal transduction histidine kinase